MTRFRLLAWMSVVATAVPAAANTDPAPGPAVMHPPQVALVEEGPKGFVYRHFPSGLRLYTFDKDRGGQSMCDAGCGSAWPPVVAPADAKPTGPWTIIQRKDGRRQWALLGRPVYVRYHDSPEIAAGDGEEGLWHLIPHTVRKSDDPFTAAPR